MNSKRKQELADSLSSALEPPRRRQGGRLSELLADYADPRDFPPPAENLQQVVPSISPVPETAPVLKDGYMLEADPILKPGPSLKIGPVLKDGPVENEPVALQINGPSYKDGPVRETALPSFSLLNSLPGVDGHLPWFNELTDYLLPQMTPNECCLYLQLYRLSWGWERSECVINFPRLSERTNMSESAARAAARGLISKGLVAKRGLVFGKNREQGIVWVVYEPPAHSRYSSARKDSPARKDRAVRKTGPSFGAPIKEHEKEQTKLHTQTGVGAGSRFALEECRRYADHLKATEQGITNPGGYATKIYRSGEADSLIETFLKPEIDITRCPDCGGSGHVYVDPKNLDKGVRPCRHPSLRG
jgi:hypothetical protein